MREKVTHRELPLQLLQQSSDHNEVALLTERNRFVD